MLKMLSFVLVCTALAAPTAQAEEDCETLGPRYYALAEKARANDDAPRALRTLQHAANACPEYKYWQELGELAAEFGEPSSNELAATSFRRTYEELATTDQERARSARSFAKLLLHVDNNPKLAEVWIFEAQRLSPESEETQVLLAEITEAAARPTSDEIVRGFFSDLAERGPKLRQKIELEGANELQTSGGGSGGRAPVAIDYELTFVTNSTEMYETSNELVANLATALSRDEFADRRFVFVGHADSRGDASANMRLSMRRANAVRDLVVSVAPTLSGRITTQGKGEQEPRDLGLSEESLKRNRRVQVWKY